MTWRGAILRAARAFTPRKGADPEIEGEMLARLLLSDEPIEREDRDLLAAFVSGKLRRPRGRPKTVPFEPGDFIAFCIVAEYRRLISEGCPRESAKVEIASKYGISRSAVEEADAWDREVSGNFRIPE
ncbi:hypothetical protein [Tranquillimonas alkanivorans]|uniref:Uncharacterized protein n=1 Tax=Tranquillimonas alkanivorans TaxID=441119 RepID=A0A1I5RXM7_9RHOB|nr:hypothetical protein [Tranquillimonas alkanivorans]SFP63071.1 hypothetical protein SAMN04488047_109136 [Tranquillimonas alkanivorans]